MERFDVLRYADDTYQVVQSGDGTRIVDAHVAEARRRKWIATVVTAVALAGVGAGAAYLWFGAIVRASGVGVFLALGGGAVRYRAWDDRAMIPELVESDVTARIVREYDPEFDPADIGDPFA